MNNIVKDILKVAEEKYPRNGVTAILRSGSVRAEIKDNEAMVYTRQSFFQGKLQEPDNSKQLLDCFQALNSNVTVLKFGDYESTVTDEERAARAAAQAAAQAEADAFRLNQEAMQRKYDTQSRIQKSNLPANSQDKCTFENSRLLDGNKEAYQAARNFIDLDADGESHFFLTLQGNYGCGKTHLAFACGWYNILQNEQKTLYYQIPSMLDMLRATFNRPADHDDDGITYEKLMDKIKKTPLLILDDIGMQKRSEWETATLDMIVDYRYEYELQTIFTTNLEVNELAPRIASRLSEGIVCKMTTPDFRRMKAISRKKKAN